MENNSKSSALKQFRSQLNLAAPNPSHQPIESGLGQRDASMLRASLQSSQKSSNDTTRSSVSIGDGKQRRSSEASARSPASFSPAQKYQYVGEYERSSTESRIHTVYTGSSPSSTSATKPSPLRSTQSASDFDYYDTATPVKPSHRNRAAGEAQDGIKDNEVTSDPGGKTVERGLADTNALQREGQHSLTPKRPVGVTTVRDSVAKAHNGLDSESTSKSPEAFSTQMRIPRQEREQQELTVYISCRSTPHHV